MIRLLTEHLAGLFNWVCSVSLMAAILVALIVVFQQVFKNRLKPRWLYLMWLLVIMRLILPWGPESEFSIYHWIDYSNSFYSDVQLSPDRMVGADQGATDSFTYRHVFVLIWVVGVCLLAAYTVWVNGIFALKLKRDTVAVTDTRVRELFYECKTRMGVQTSIGLVQSSQLASPALFGFLKPVLIIPHNLAGSLNDDEWRHIFLHELAHSKRNDIKVNGLMYALLIIHWFNPVLWYAYRRMRDDQEIASDALALSCLNPEQRQDYGYTLIKLLESFSQPARAMGSVNWIGHKAQLQRRMRMIKQFKAQSYRWSFLGAAIMVFISGCTLTNPPMESTSSPLASSAITSADKPAGSEQQVMPESSTKPAGAGDQLQSVADNSAQLSDSAGADSTKTEAKPQPAETRPAAADQRPMPVASTREPTAAPAASERRVPVQESRPAAAQAQKPRAVPSERQSAPAPAPRVIPAGSSVTETSPEQSRPAAPTAESAPSAR
ncbi:M56 family metallopeptidase [Bacillus sp. 3255]|uniref:M56 family metallopeptidase n=1 Tax=Bacillus sp. 3255 TaxID=2817904 RepID=UPI0028569D69|nr:M56 family metallopeptidase [Bacillus sp. 3255]MDR6883288.1 bla regulator protein BlaR1 [Bacillus sp. 3255]